MARSPKSSNGAVHVEYSITTSLPAHPILFNDQNLCSLSILKQLDTISLINVKKILHALNITLRCHDKHKKLCKEHYMEQLDNYLKLCKCRNIANTFTPSSSMSGMFQTI